MVAANDIWKPGSSTDSGNSSVTMQRRQRQSAHGNRRPVEQDRAERHARHHERAQRRHA